MTDLYRAKSTSVFRFQGRRHRIIRKRTVVRAGHPIMEGREHLFEPYHIDWDLPADGGGVEVATANPGEKRTLPDPAPEPEADDGLEALRSEAEAAGVKVDGRWGVDRIRKEIDAANSDAG